LGKQPKKKKTKLKEKIICGEKRFSLRRSQNDHGIVLC
jgi:hypothetical protein